MRVGSAVRASQTQFCAIHGMNESVDALAAGRRCEDWQIRPCRKAIPGRVADDGCWASPMSITSMATWGPATLATGLTLTNASAKHVSGMVCGGWRSGSQAIDELVGIERWRMMALASGCRQAADGARAVLAAFAEEQGKRGG